MKTLTPENARKVLEQYWGYPDFRTGQLQAIQSVLDGEDTLVLFPTGGGKSLCYQVPALMLDGLTIVISPLVALMQDQVDQLQRLGIRATFINSTLSSFEVEQRLVNARNGMYKLLYLAPERLATTLWKAEQASLNISLVAVDEAHCISEWGHDFRPTYRKIKDELDELPGTVRWIALTATATPEVKSDMLDTLKFESPSVITNGFQRKNLWWWVTHTHKKRDSLNKAVLRASKMGSGIIYSSTRRNCEQLAEYFTGKGVKTEAYHAGLTADNREQVQQRWINGKTPVVAATNAFGMGIDKSDCRFVIHHTLPLSLEAYYQEAGRAGRDGEAAYPVLIYKEGDERILKERIMKSYPDYDILQTVYNALCDEFDLATGSLQESPAPADIGKIAKRAQLPSGQVNMALQLLQRLDVIIKYELHHSRVGIHFKVGSDYLVEVLDEMNPSKAEFLDLLMRQYGPQAFRQMEFLDEPYITDKLQVNSHQLRKALTVFSDHDQLLEYQWQSEVDLVQLIEPRMRKLQIDHGQAYRYRDILLKKLKYMVRYANTSHCRELFLRRYFGETDCQPCGRCDNCQKNDITGTSKASEEIKTVITLLKTGNATAVQIKKETGLPGRRVKEIIEYLDRENLIERAEEELVNYRLRIR